MDINRDWTVIRKLFADSIKSGGYCSVATVNTDGSPRVAPIGSLFLLEDGQGLFFEKFPQDTRKNMENDGRICVLAVNSGLWYWITSLFKGQFASPPGIRLMGRAGDRRPATGPEKEQWLEKVRRFKWSKGYDRLWSDMKFVREVEFDTAELLQTGAMTSGMIQA